MRILQVNKFHYRRGGAETYFLDIIKKLEAAGHEVAVFSMRHPKNLPSPWEKYFVSRISFNEPKLRDKLITPGRLIWSLEAERKFARLVRDFKPDVIHIHNIYHQISPSILAVARKHKIPVVMHLHDYKMVCPNYKLFTHNQVCRRCLKHKYYEAVGHNCFRDSFFMSALVMKEMYIHHVLLKIYEKAVDSYIAPSRFMKETMVQFGHPENKIKVIYNFIDPEWAGDPAYDKKPADSAYLLYFGRLSPEKGIDVLLNALAQARPGFSLKIAGDGPEKANLQNQIKALKLDGRVEFLGYQSGAALKKTVNEARAIIMPSLWLENMPFALMEAVAGGRIVIASEIGGFPEVIKDKENGFLFPAGDVSALVRILDDLDKYDLEKISAAARATAAQFNLADHYRALLEIYQQAIADKKTSRSRP